MGPSNGFDTSEPTSIGDSRRPANDRSARFLLVAWNGVLHQNRRTKRITPIIYDTDVAKAIITILVKERDTG